jgi:hypothetical protein
MRYPGEWKFPGGVAESGDKSLVETAVRELQEEFPGMVVTDDAKLLMLNKKLTMPVKGRQYWMHTCVALSEDNNWITDDCVSVINLNLADRHQKFLSSLCSGAFWEVNDEEKIKLSPELNRVDWIDIDRAISMMESSMFDPVVHVDEWQRMEFEKYNIQTRDPMYQSMCILEEIRQLNNIENIREQAAKYSNSA